MGSMNSFMSKFSRASEEAPVELLSAGAPNALAAFMEKFDRSMESYFFYEGTVELKFDKENHKYYLVEQLGNLSVRKGVTTVVKVIDRSNALMPWAAKKVAEKIIKLVKVQPDGMLEPMTLAYFTELVMQAKKTPQEEKEEAGDIGHMAHECLEDSIRYALDHTQDHIVRELKNIPSDEKAATAAQSAFKFMQTHNVRWIETEGKIYSREHGYAGTMDGLAYVDSCSDCTCCRTKFINHFSLIDWKSSNYLYIEYLFQTAAYAYAKQEESGVKIEDRWVLRLGKNEEEAGKFEPWYMGPEDFAEDFAGFLTCLHLVALVDSVTSRMKTQKQLLRAVKKEIKAAAKAYEKQENKILKARMKAEKKVARDTEKAAAKVAAEEAKSAERIARATEKARIKEESRAAREEARSNTKTVALPEVPTVKMESVAVGGTPITKVVDSSNEEEVEVQPQIFAIPEEQ